MKGGVRPTLSWLALAALAGPPSTAEAQTPAEVTSEIRPLRSEHSSDRSLSRLEYTSAGRNLFGLTLDFSQILPDDGGASSTAPDGANVLPPALKQRYLEAAQQLLDHVIILPPFVRSFGPGEFVTADGKPLPEGSFSEDVDASVEVTIPVGGDYAVRVGVEAVSETPVSVALRVDGVTAHRFIAPAGAPTPESTVLGFSRGKHTVALRAADGEARIGQLSLTEKIAPPSAEKLAAHARIFGDAQAAWRKAATPAARRAEAAMMLGDFSRRAFRRPVTATEIDAFVGLYDQAAARAEPFEAAVKFALTAVLTSPQFLFQAKTR